MTPFYRIYCVLARNNDMRVKEKNSKDVIRERLLSALLSGNESEHAACKNTEHPQYSWN
jgi:hypothetical protein